MRVSLLRLSIAAILSSLTFFGCQKTNVPSPDLDLVNAKISGKGMKLLNQADNAAILTKRMNSLLIVQNEELVFEHYYNGTDRSTYQNTKSVTKSIMAGLLGIAIEEGDISGIEDKVFKYMPDIIEWDKSIGKKDISLRNLVTMTTGLASTSPDGIDRMQDSDDWARYVLDMAINHTPGSHYEYNTGNMHLVSTVIAAATKENTRAFAEQRLFKPLGIAIGDWQVDRNGIPHGGNNLFLRPIDMAKIGILFMQDGQFQGKQIIPQEWVSLCLTKEYDPDRIWTPFHFEGIGYMWWLFRFMNHQAVAAWGHGGQFIILIPDIELVIVMTARSDDLVIPTEYYREVCRIIEVYIIPAFENVN